jgi:hypothetical protein
MPAFAGKADIMARLTARFTGFATTARV